MSNELIICICIAAVVIVSVVACVLYIATRKPSHLEKPPGSWTYELQVIPRKKIKNGKFTHSYDGCRIAIIRIESVHDIKADPREIAIWIGMTYGIPRHRLQVVYKRGDEPWMGMAVIRYKGVPQINITSCKKADNWRAASVALMEYVYKLELSELERLKQERAYAKENTAKGQHSEESYH